VFVFEEITYILVYVDVFCVLYTFAK
jgi:hypothetical protein